MFDAKSRYHDLETATFVRADGRMIAYKRRRFVPAPAAALVLREVVPPEGERLDLLAARTLGDAEAFFHICDANDVMSPFDLLSERQRPLRIPTPRP